MTDSAIPQDALRLLISDGFEATSVDQLAAAAGISRSTFFRRYGSKEDMVFADLDSILAGVDAGLAPLRRLAERPTTGTGAEDREVLEVLLATTLSVFDHHTAHAEVSRLRHHLLSAVPALRDRELVSTHRYERAFRHALRGLLGDEATAAALAAAIVAVHNTRLRQWLRAAEPSAAATAAARASLEADLRRIAGSLLAAVPSVHGPAPTRGEQRATVVVTVLKSGPGSRLDEADLETSVLEALHRHLRTRDRE